MTGIKVPKANIYPTFSLANLKKQFKPRNIVSAMASDGFLPVIALEAFVEGGRTYQAYKRGGFDEARERITEEFSGAVFWLGGVTALNWVFEKLGQKILNLPSINVDIASDEVRNPLVRYLRNEKKKGGGVITEKAMAKFKFTKVAASVIIANAFIGFILPKINQAITRARHKNDNINNINANGFITQPSMDNFANCKENDKDTSFTGKWDLLTLANNFESKRNWKLLSVDVGTCTGRVYSARNNNERVEIGFRDIASIYFYMFNMANMNSWLNQLEQGKGNKTRLDPASAKFATKYLNNYVGDGKVDFETFTKEVLGENKELPENIKAKFNNKVITLDDFNAELKNMNLSAEKLSELEQIAQKMSELQPERILEVKEIENGKEVIKMAEKRILTMNQAKDVLNGGHINDPEFLKEFYANALGHRKFLNVEKGKYKFVAQSTFDALKSDLTNYVKSIVDQAKKANAKEITSDILKQASKHNFKMNLINWGAGFVVSAAFLSTIIPKLQYYITKMRTGENEFPGTEQFRHPNNQTTNKAA
jgi:predicted Zn-dependent protease with MMP-like domain